MSLHVIPDGRGGSCFVTMADIYEYRGLVFEFHSYCGPHPLRKDGELTKRFPGPKSRFWPVFEDWMKLSKAEKQKTRWSGRTAAL